MITPTSTCSTEQAIAFKKVFLHWEDIDPSIIPGDLFYYQGCSWLAKSATVFKEGKRWFVKIGAVKIGSVVLEFFKVPTGRKEAIAAIAEMQEYIKNQGHNFYAKVDKRRDTAAYLRAARAYQLYISQNLPLLKSVA